MDYENGEPILIGDTIEYSDGSTGCVVCSIDAGEYSPDYPSEQWSYLKVGVMVLSESFGLVHYPEKLESGTRLQSRGPAI